MLKPRIVKKRGAFHNAANIRSWEMRIDMVLRSAILLRAVVVVNGLSSRLVYIGDEGITTCSYLYLPLQGFSTRIKGGGTKSVVFNACCFGVSKVAGSRGIEHLLPLPTLAEPPPFQQQKESRYLANVSLSSCCFISYTTSMPPTKPLPAHPTSPR